MAIVACAAVIFCLCAPTAALASGMRGSLAWSPQPTFLNAGMDMVDPGLDAIACPSDSECVAVDTSGREASFDPADPSGWSGYAIDGHHYLVGVACPAVAQCTAVDAGGAEVTFDPATGAVGSRVVIDAQAHAAIGQIGGQTVTGVACPTVSVCLAIDSGGQAMSFAPASPSAVQTVSLSGGQLSAISCPSSSRCTVLAAAWTAPDGTDHGEIAITLNPSSLAVASSLALPVTSAMYALACPTVGECVGAGYGDCSASMCQAGATLTFAPLSTAAPQADPSLGVAQRSSVGLRSIACPSSSLCAAMDDSGAVATFDPASAGDTAQAAIDQIGDWPKGVNAAAIACPSVELCALAAWNEPAALIFAPQSPDAPMPVAIDDGAPVVALSCPAPGECVSLAVTQTRYAPGPLGVGAVVDPGAQSHANGFGLLYGLAEAVACPVRRQCTVISRESGALPRAVTFNPYRPPSNPTGTLIDAAPNRIEALTCPTRRQCTAVDRRGRELTFDPTRLRSHVSATISSGPLTALSCPSAMQCTAVDARGHELSFVPQSGAPISDSRIDGHTQLTSVACPTKTQCTATDRRGTEVTFDPRRGTVARHARIDHAELTSIACPASDLCVAADTAGVALSGDPQRPRGWMSTRLPGASSLLAVACASVRECVATDSIGNAYTTTAR